MATDEETESKTRTIPEKSDDTRRIENRMRNTEIGETVTYDDLSKILGRDVREHCRGNLHSARRTLTLEGIHFGTVMNEGVKRLSPEEAISSARQQRLRAKSATKSGIKILKHIEFSGLTDDGKRSHLSESAALGAMELFSREASVKKIESKVNGEGLAIGETLKLFGG